MKTRDRPKIRGLCYSDEIESHSKQVQLKIYFADDDNAKRRTAYHVRVKAPDGKLFPVPPLQDLEASIFVAYHLAEQTASGRGFGVRHPEIEPLIIESKVRNKK